MFITSKGKIIKPFPQWRGLTLFHSDNQRHNTHPGLTKLDCNLPDKNILTIVRAPILSSSNINFLIKLKLRLQHVVRRKIFSLICSFFCDYQLSKVLLFWLSGNFLCTAITPYLTFSSITTFGNFSTPSCPEQRVLKFASKIKPLIVLLTCSIHSCKALIIPEY